MCVCVYCERMSRDLSEDWSNHIELLCYCNNIVMVLKWVQNNELFFHYFLISILIIFHYQNHLLIHNLVIIFTNPMLFIGLQRHYKRSSLNIFEVLWVGGWNLKSSRYWWGRAKTPSSPNFLSTIGITIANFFWVGIKGENFEK
jgi:hypothetical protein